MPGQLPFVDYLVLGDAPHLRAAECSSCRARYFDRRNACAACGRGEFEPVEISRTGTVKAFTIVSVAAPGVPVPFVAAVVDCAGTSVRGNIVGCPPDLDHVGLGMSVRLSTYSLGIDQLGNEAIGFGFEPLESEAQA
ncbi:Zn-ribbon domain-containing OB-fold protein [Nocardia vaccinii]|uniref:Zn-ribbon domain-containing OB-fold protein n=1 Tax=Nocardia vaccinii TaxID=1822 RepID=UPI00082C8D74|nr:OB-fold domain-containing protein [Nocardia vaccinii]